MRRYKDVIESNKARRFEISRQQWTTYRNFLHMYLDIERMLIASNLASKLPSPIMVDCHGNEVLYEPNCYGCKVTTKFHYPQCCIVMDEVGADLNMMNDGSIGGARYLSRKGDVAKMNATKN